MSEVSEPTSADPVKLTWRQGKSAPKGMHSSSGAAVAHGNKAYFSNGHDVYSYTVPEDKWTRLQPNPYKHFGLTVIKDQLTTIGGYSPLPHGHGSPTNSLLDLSGNEWEEHLPPMPTSRMFPAAATTPTHLVVAGGRSKLLGGVLSTVEVLKTETSQWSTASHVPREMGFPEITLCDGCFYLSQTDGTIFSCSVTDLLQSCDPSSTNSSDGGSVWTTLANIPVEYSSLATLRGHVLAIGGEDGDNLTGAIHCYDVVTNSWSAICEMPTPRYEALTAVLPSNELVVVGGRPNELCFIIKIERLEPYFTK